MNLFSRRKNMTKSYQILYLIMVIKKSNLKIIKFATRLHKGILEVGSDTSGDEYR